MKAGKLYQIKQHFWYIYPSWYIATAIGHVARRWRAHAAVEEAVAYWSKQYNCNVTYISPNSIFCLLEKDGEYLKVLTSNGEIGWMRYEKKEWTKGCFEEVKE